MGINFESSRKNLKMQFAAATLVAAASAAGIGSSNGAADANSVRLARPDSPSIVHTNCGVGFDGVSTCWEAYAAFVPAANQTLGEGDLTDSYGTEWDLQNGKGDCGLIINDSSNNMQNATCAISYTPGAIVNFGGSAFVYDANTVAGLDFSSEVSAVFTWDNEIADIDAWVATKDANITDTSIADCFTSGNNRQATIGACTQNDNANSVTRTMIMFTNNIPGTTNGFAIGNYGPSVSVTMNVACSTVTSSMATVTFVDASTCSFVLDVTDARAALLIFEADTQSVVDFFAVSVQ